MSIELDPKEQAAQDRRMLVAMGLTALVVFAYYNFFAPPLPPPPIEPASIAEQTPAPVAAPTPGVAPAPAPVVSVINAPSRVLERSWEQVRSLATALSKAQILEADVGTAARDGNNGDDAAGTQAQ